MEDYAEHDPSNSLFKLLTSVDPHHHHTKNPNDFCVALLLFCSRPAGVRKLLEDRIQRWESFVLAGLWKLQNAFWCDRNERWCHEDLQRVCPSWCTQTGMAFWQRDVNIINSVYLHIRLLLVWFMFLIVSVTRLLWKNKQFSFFLSMQCVYFSFYWVDMQFTFWKHKIVKIPTNMNESYCFLNTGKHWLCDKKRNQRKYLSSGAKLLRQGTEADIPSDGKRLLSSIFKVWAVCRSPGTGWREMKATWRTTARRMLLCMIDSTSE